MFRARHLKFFYFFLSLKSFYLTAFEAPQKITPENSPTVFHELIVHWPSSLSPKTIYIEADANEAFTSYHRPLAFLRERTKDELNTLHAYLKEELKKETPSFISLPLGNIFEVFFFLDIRRRSTFTQFLISDLIKHFNHSKIKRPENSSFSYEYDLYDLFSYQLNKFSEKQQRWHQRNPRLRPEEEIRTYPFQDYTDQNIAHSFSLLFSFEPARLRTLHSPSNPGSVLYAVPHGPMFFPVHSAPRMEQNYESTDLYTEEEKKVIQGLLRQVHEQYSKISELEDLLEYLNIKSPELHKLISQIGAQHAHYLLWNLSHIPALTIEELELCLGIEKESKTLLHRFGYVPQKVKHSFYGSDAVEIYGDMQPVNNRKVDQVLPRNMRAVSINLKDRRIFEADSLIISSHAKKSHKFIYALYKTLLDKERPAFNEEFLENLEKMDSDLEIERLFFLVFENSQTQEIEGAFSIYNSMKFSGQEDRPLLPSERHYNKYLYSKKEAPLEIIHLGKKGRNFSFKRMAEALALYLYQFSIKGQKIIAHTDTENLSLYEHLGFHQDFDSKSGLDENHFILSVSSDEFMERYLPHDTLGIRAPRKPNPVEMKFFSQSQQSRCDSMMTSTISSPGGTSQIFIPRNL